MFDPFDKKSFQTGREKRLRCTNLMAWLMGIKKASRKSRIRNFKKGSHFIDVDLAAILLLKRETTAALFEFVSHRHANASTIEHVNRFSSGV